MKGLPYLLLIISSILFSSCQYSYYKINMVFEPQSDEILKQKEQGKLILLHDGFNSRDPRVEVLLIDDIKYDEVNNRLSAYSISASMQYDIKYNNYLTAKYERLNSYDENLHPEILKTAHLYAKSIKTIGDTVIVNLNDVSRMETYSLQKNNAQNTSKQNTSIFVILAAILVIII